LVSFIAAGYFSGNIPGDLNTLHESSGGKVKVSLCLLIKHHTMKMYGGVEV
jgi:hypothetical protein